MRSGCGSPDGRGDGGGEFPMLLRRRREVTHGEGLHLVQRLGEVLLVREDALKQPLEGRAVRRGRLALRQKSLNAANISACVPGRVSSPFTTRVSNSRQWWRYMSACLSIRISGRFSTRTAFQMRTSCSGWHRRKALISSSASSIALKMPISALTVRHPLGQNLVEFVQRPLRQAPSPSRQLARIRHRSSKTHRPFHAGHKASSLG